MGMAMGRGRAAAIRSASVTGWSSRFPWLILAVAGAAGVAVFAAAHPFGPLSGGLIAAVLVVGMCLHRLAWLVLVPGLMPVIDLAPWSGAIYLTESDALVCSALLACGLREVLATVGGGDGRSWRFGVLQIGLLGALLASYALSTDWSVLQGMWAHPEWRVSYASPLNGVRLAKGALWAALLLAPLSAAFRREPEQAGRALVRGVLLGLVLTSLAAFWERFAFAGLADFASDYRTTALFWEMNVGGATLDGWLALAVPFALWAALRAETPRRLALLMTLLILVAYVCFTTFSRGLYLGLVLGGALTALLTVRGEVLKGRMQFRRLPVLVWSGFVVALGAALAGVFQSGGYRGLGAMLGLAFAVFAGGPVVATLPRRALALAAALAGAALVASVAVMWLLPKGVYLAYGASLLGVVALLWIEPRGRLVAQAGTLVAAGVGWLAGNVVLVVAYWSEGGGVGASLLAVLAALLPLAVAVTRPKACWRPTLRACTVVALVLGSVSVVVVTFNTYYASKRFETVSEDLDGRFQHWSLAAALPQGERERWLGVGVGQFAERYFWRVPDGMYPGSHRVEVEDGRNYLRLGGPRHVLGFGELYRVSQRVSPMLQIPLVVALNARAPEGAGRLHVEVCRKHLLYSSECVGKELAVPAGPQWRHFEFALEGHGLGSDGGWLPRLTMFSIAAAERGKLIEVTGTNMIDAYGTPLLENGDFSAAGDYWFFSSDRHHLPWHAKNLWLHYLVEHGLVGLVAFSLFALAAFYRAALGGAARHPLAAPLAGGLLGFFAVGAFDSLVDAPRLTTFTLLLMLLALGLRPPRPGRRGPQL